MKDISGKTAIVMGAASGIGLALATALPERAPIWSWPTSRKMRSKRPRTAAPGRTNALRRCGLTIEHAVVDALAEAERAFDELHVACNNAGATMHGTRLTDVPH